MVIMHNDVQDIEVKKSNHNSRRKSPFILSKDQSSLPHIPTALYTQELFDKSDEVVNDLKNRRLVNN